jgi:hypothetical protein
VHIRCKQFDLGGSFSVFIFFGPLPEDPFEWFTDGSYVGVFDVFANASPEECPNCTAQRNKILHGVVHIDGALAQVLKELDDDRDKLKDDEEDIVSFLTDCLTWGVMRVS